MQISTVAFIFKESDLNSADLCVGAAGRYQRGKDWSDWSGETVVRNLPYVMSAGINKSPAANLAHFIIKNQVFPIQKLYIRSFSVAAPVGLMLCFKIQLIASGTEYNASISSRKITFHCSY